MMLIALAVFGLLLQPGMTGMTPDLNQASHPADSAVVLQDCEKADASCATAECSAHRCNMGAGMACYWLCTHMPLQIVIQAGFAAKPVPMTGDQDISGLAPRRLERPFRPPI